MVGALHGRGLRGYRRTHHVGPDVGGRQRVAAAGGGRALVRREQAGVGDAQVSGIELRVQARSDCRKVVVCLIERGTGSVPRAVIGGCAGVDCLKYERRHRGACLILQL